MEGMPDVLGGGFMNLEWFRERVPKEASFDISFKRWKGCAVVHRIRKAVHSSLSKAEPSESWPEIVLPASEGQA